MNKILRYSFMALLAMMVGNVMAQDVTLDFTLETEEGSKQSVWGFPASSKNKQVEEQSFTYNGYTVKVAGSEGNGYYWHERTFVNYCPYCHRYGVLTNLHKWPARHEQEISCSRCRSDWCGVCGKEKMGYSKKYLRKI